MLGEAHTWALLKLDLKYYMVYEVWGNKGVRMISIWGKDGDGKGMIESKQGTESLEG